MIQSVDFEIRTRRRQEKEESQSIPSAWKEVIGLNFQVPASHFTLTIFVGITKDLLSKLMCCMT